MASTGEADELAAQIYDAWVAEPDAGLFTMAEMAVDICAANVAAIHRRRGSLVTASREVIVAWLESAASDHWHASRDSHNTFGQFLPMDMFTDRDFKQQAGIHRPLYDPAGRPPLGKGVRDEGPAA